jgi:hypothetical protein
MGIFAFNSGICFTSKGYNTAITPATIAEAMAKLTAAHLVLFSDAT